MAEQSKDNPCGIDWIEEPFDAYENQLVAQIEALRRDYERAAQPLISALARSRAAKPRSYVIFMHAD